jgi:methionyl-tRNA formyltransferase
VDARGRINEDRGVGLCVVVVSNVPPIAEHLVPLLRELGHDPRALIASRRPPGWPAPPPGMEPMGDASAPDGVDLLFARDKHSIEPLLAAYEPDLMLCWGFPWKLTQAALDVPRLGSINCHPGPLPRHRGPIPFAWTLRSGDSHFGIAWHRMDAEFDTGAILARTSVRVLDTDTTIFDIGPRIVTASLGLLPLVLEKVAAGDPGEPQDESLATWAGHFEDDQYAVVDWSRPARAVHDQVRAWQLTFGMSGIVAPRAELDGELVRLLRTSISDPGGEARRVECGDGPIWILESEPLGVASAEASPRAASRV